MAETPLSGRRVVVTRSEEQADRLADRLAALGAEALIVPAIQLVAVEDAEPVRVVIGGLDSADWLVFTSANGVRFSRPFLAAAWPEGLPGGLRVAAIGPGTAEACAAAGLSVDFMPPEHVSESIVETLPDVEERRVVLLHAARARPVLAGGLRARGARVDEVAVYDTRPGAAPDDVRRALQRQPDALTFTSASTVDGFASGLCGAPWPRAASVAIGPVTAAALARHGITPAATADPHTLDGLVDALVSCFA